jgi:hypothetical protein
MIYANIINVVIVRTVLPLSNDKSQNMLTSDISQLLIFPLLTTVVRRLTLQRLRCLVSWHSVKNSKTSPLQELVFLDLYT